MFRNLCLVLVVLMETVQPIVGHSYQSWSYGGQTGPKNWCKLGYKECCDGYQSPVDLVPGTMKYQQNHLRLSNQNAAISQVQLTNDGHAVKLTFKSDKLPMLYCPRYEFIIDNIHFHVRSEHTVKGQHFPLEAHFVYRNSRYPSIDTAINNAHGIAVLATFFQVCRDQNIELDGLINSLKFVRQPRQRYRITSPFSASTLLPDLSRHGDYYTYNGSLTTPPCSHVPWVIFAKPVCIGAGQLQEFSRISYDPVQDGQDFHTNNRPLQKCMNRRFRSKIGSNMVD